MVRRYRWLLYAQLLLAPFVCAGFGSRFLLSAQVGPGCLTSVRGALGPGLLWAGVLVGALVLLWVAAPFLVRHTLRRTDMPGFVKPLGVLVIALNVLLMPFGMLTLGAVQILEPMANARCVHVQDGTVVFESMLGSESVLLDDIARAHVLSSHGPTRSQLWVSDGHGRSWETVELYGTDQPQAQALADTIERARAQIE